MQHQQQARQPKGTSTGGQYAAEPHTEPVVSLTPAAPPELVATLDRYGLTLDDIPADHEGLTLVDRWNQAAELASADTIPTTTSVLWDQLGDMETGRHRSGPDPVWWDEHAAADPDIELDYADDPDDPRWDDPNAILAAWIHTRNGGGNRECYCEGGEHEPGCLAGVIDAMHAHPAFLADHDDTGDSTYANFHFRIEGKDAVRDAVRLAPEARRQAWARATLEQIATGEADPWMLFPPNPDTQAAAAAARKQLTALGTTDMTRRQADRIGLPVHHTGGYYGSQSVDHITATPEHLADFDALLAWAKDPNDEPPADTATWKDGLGTRYYLRARGERYVASLTRARQAGAARAALDAGDLPEDVAVVLRAGLDNADLGKFARAEQEARKAREVLAKVVDEAAADRDLLASAVKKGRERERLRTLANPPARVLHWPGTPDTVPPEPAPAAAAHPPREGR